MSGKKRMGKEKDNDFLHRQLIKLGDMMGDCLHHESGGEWIEREYGRILKALGIGPPKKKRRNDSQGINEFMKDAVNKRRCPECDDQFIQTRSGSLRAECQGCGNIYQLGKRVRSKRRKA